MELHPFWLWLAAGGVLLIAEIATGSVDRRVARESPAQDGPVRSVAGR